MIQLIECVPNFSEGRDANIIDQIADAIDSVEGVKLLNVDPGHAANRTVMTFIGTPQEVIDAAFLGIRKAAELIDMSQQTGEHPRIGATDVCPLIPISNIEMQEVVAYAHQLGERIGKELNIPGYYYEFAASKEERRNLAVVRQGEYEGLKTKLADPNWKPDFGPNEFKTAKITGATAISARNFLIAYNINLNTSSTKIAHTIACDVREKGRIKREGNKKDGQIIRDKQGKPLWNPGTLKHLKAIGWYIEEYQLAQVSMNLTNMLKTPIHTVFEEVSKKATLRGVKVTGSELIGLIPKSALLSAGNYFIGNKGKSSTFSEREIIEVAVNKIGLNALAPFHIDERIIEYALNEDFGSQSDSQP